MSNPIKPNIKTEITPILLLVLTAAASFYFYSHFPAVVPTHWDFSGQPNGWSGKTFAAFGIPLILIGMYLFFLALPVLDPRKERYAEFKRPYHIFKDLIVCFMAAIYFIASFNALGYDIPVSLYVPIIVGILFIIMGNYLGKIKPNWFMGIRTPWTLSDEEVWNKTHRLGGRLFMLGGLGMIVEAALPLDLKMPIFIIIIITVAVVPVVYSYLEFKKKMNGH